MNNLESILSFLPAVKFDGNCCILASLTIRDVLRRLGHSAQVRSVGLRMKAAHDGFTLHQLGVGMDALWGTPYKGKDWPGHLVVVTNNWLIDPTFYATRRKSWEWIPDVAIAQRAIASPPDAIQVSETRSLPVLAVMKKDVPELDYHYEAIWLGTSANQGWQGSPDTQPVRRRDTVDQIVKEFMAWTNERI